MNYNLLTVHEKILSLTLSLPLSLLISVGG